MSAASDRNLGLAVRERDRRTALSLDSPGTPGIAQAGYLMPGWDALYGAGREQAAAAGQGYRLSGNGLPVEPQGTTRPGDEDIQRTLEINDRLSAMNDQRKVQDQSLRAMTAGADIAQTQAGQAQRDLADRDALDRNLAPVTQPTTVTRTPADVGPQPPGAPPAAPTITARPAGPVDPRQMLLNSLPGHMRPQMEQTLAAMDQKAATTKLQQDALTAKVDAAKAKTDAAGQPDDDVVQAVGGMKEGTIPPQLPGRASKDYTKIMAEARRQGYDLAGAATDWTATQKHIATLNGAQQLRLNQSINALPDMLDSVDALASQWKGGKFPILNKANLALAKGGAYGPEVASVATRLDAQIADVTADLGNVYMGGNSPTDHALGLAAKSFQSDWDEKVFHDMVKLAKGNVQIRQNSIRNTGVAGASANNPYGGGQPAASPAVPPAPAGFVDMIAPDGRPLHVPSADVARMSAAGAKRKGGG